MFTSIRWRIAAPFVILIALVMSTLGIWVGNFVRQTQMEDLEQELISEARLLSDVLKPELSGETPSVELDSQAKVWSQILNTRVTIIAADGTVLGESDQDRTQMENHLDRPEVQEALQSGIGQSIRFSRTVEFRMLYVATSILEGDSLLGFARIALPLQEIDQNVTRIRSSIFIATLLATLLAVVLAALIAARTTLPLIKLTETAKKMSTGDRTDKLIPTTRDEVGQLTRAFNNMGAQIRSQIEALQTERIKLAAVLAEMTDGVLIVNELGEVQLINPAAEQMFSVREDEAIGHSLAGVLRHHQLVELWQQCRETGEERDALLEISTKGIILQGLAIPLEQALPGSILLLFQDLTHLRRLETVRRDFISNISHELRTPLASLKALTETLQEGALEDPPAARRFLGRMEAEVDSLTLMVQELLELSRIESGKVPLQLTPISPCSLLFTASERLRLQAERAELNLEVNCADQLPDVWADPPRMEQVIVNLLHNAIKFTPSGGEITLSAWQDHENIIFSVQDNGVGIPADDLSRIFERFFKSDRARTTGGTGLGLAISRHLIEAHAGRIWAESVEGKGSSFYFQLPIAS